MDPSAQNEVRSILERLKLRLGPSYEDLEEIAWGMKPEKAKAYWEEQLAAAKKAEQISLFNKEERRAHEERLAELRGQAATALYEAHAYSCMLWEQLSEGEEFELDPEAYWLAQIIEAKRVAEKRAAEHAEWEAKRPKTGAELLARAAEAEVLSGSKKVRALVDLFCWAMELEEILAKEPATRAEVERLCTWASGDSVFVHSSLSIAEDLFCILREIKGRPDYVA